MTRREQIAEQALALSPEDREFVADALEQSLENQGFATSGIADEWVAEVSQRLSSFDRGETAACDAETAIRKLRNELAARRAERSQ